MLKIFLWIEVLFIAGCSSFGVGNAASLTPTPIKASTPFASMTPISTPTLLPFIGKIAFTVLDRVMFNNQMYVMTANGSELKNITPPNLLEIQNLAWSPDGQYLAFNADAGHVFQIFKIKSDGSGLAQLTFRDRGAGSPSWSPDGKYIMFEATSPDILGKMDLSNQDEPVPQIYIMKSDGSDVRRFTVKTKADDTPMIGSYRYDGLISVSERDTRIGAIIYIIDSDGVIQKQFPELPSYFPPVWSPDGKFILFSTLRTDCSGVKLPFYIPIENRQNQAF